MNELNGIKKQRFFVLEKEKKVEKVLWQGMPHGLLV